VGFKLFIVLVWLTVPAALGLLLQADREHYAADSAAQRSACLERIDLLKRHTTLLSGQAARLAEVEDQSRLQTWRITWSSLKGQYARDLPPLRLQELSHYPATALALDDQAAALQELQDTVDTAGRNREYYLRGAEAMNQVAEEIDYLNYQAQRYRMYGAEGVYFLLQDRLAQAEARFQHQQHEQQRLQDAVHNGLSQARHQAAQIQSALDLADGEIAQDEKVTYVDAMRQRFAAFDLKSALSELLARLAGAPQPAAP
jgi:hypothetical protein